MTLTDNGTLSFAAGDTVSFNDNGYYYGAQIVVGSGGLLQATGTAFNATNGNSTNGNNFTQIVVNSGGHLQASGSTFALGQVYLADGVVFNAGDLAATASTRRSTSPPSTSSTSPAPATTTSGSRASTSRRTPSPAARRWP